MTAKRLDIVTEVQEGMAAEKKPSRWFNCVDPKHRDTIAELRDAWLSGRLGKRRRTAARVIARVLNQRGISDVQEGGVDTWLAELS